MYSYLTLYRDELRYAAFFPLFPSRLTPTLHLLSACSSILFTGEQGKIFSHLCFPIVSLIALRSI